MPLAGNEIDANFFSLVHRVVAEQTKRASQERRADKRTLYQASARISPRRGRGVPDESEFFEVQCHDLNCGGFSFLLPQRPKFCELVVCFGAPPEAIYLLAEAVHCDDVTVYPDGQAEQQDDAAAAGNAKGGKRMCLVGCQFVDRVQR